MPVVDEEVVDLGQVADVAAQDDVDDVLDRAGVGAVADAQVGLALVGAEGDEQDLRAGPSFEFASEFPGLRRTAENEDLHGPS